ncbi:MAG: hypothetical protein IJ727_06195 [Treponema sp.]|nr:hypothetical protein [Treponema sp.]
MTHTLRIFILRRLTAILLFVLFVFSSLSAESEKDILHDGYLGVDYSPESYSTLSGTTFRMEFFGKSGTFKIYGVSGEGKEKPLLSGADYADTSGFLLRVGGVVYRLNKDKRVLRELRRLDESVQLSYTVDDALRLIVDFSSCSSHEDSKSDVIKVTSYVINLTGDSHDVGLKGIFDTCLGEVSSVHFHTDAGTKIRNERSFSMEDMHRERAVISSDGDFTFQFVLDGLKVTPVSYIGFANVDELYRMSWEAPFRKGRGFTNARSYDNSAMLICWPDIELLPDEKSESTFYIAVASDGEMPSGLAYVDKLPLENQKPRVESGSGNEISPEPASEKRTDVDFIVPPIKDYQLDAGYIQDLIDRIDALQSAKNVDHKTVSRLNAELDAILEKLRRR